MSPLIPTVPPAQERPYSIETSVRLIVGNLSEHLLQGFGSLSRNLPIRFSG
jgi:hypothetical protein